MGRCSCCCAKVGLKQGRWTALEDRVLTSYIKVHGEGKWANLPKRAGLKRCGKSCRLRWLNYLKPDIKRGNISPDEEELILRLHRLLGNRWSMIAGRLPGRTDNEIKNYLKRKYVKKANPPSPQEDQKGPSTTATVVLKPLATKATWREVIPPSPQEDQKGPSTTTEVLKPLAMRPQAVNSNDPTRIDLHHNEVNTIDEYRVPEFSTFQHDDRHLGRLVDEFENNNVDDPFNLSNLWSVENFLMEDCIGKDMESLLNADEWLDS